MNKNIAISALVIIIVAIVVLVIFKPMKRNIPTPVDVEPVATIPVIPEPSSLTTTLPMYVGGQEGWPPMVTHSANMYVCTPGITGMDIKTTVTQKTINGRVYCIESSTEGAAGTSYKTFKYTTASTGGNGTETTQFVLRYVNCGNYRDTSGNGGPEYNQCVTNQTGFDVDAVVDSVM